MSKTELPVGWSKSRIGDVVEDHIERGLPENEREFTYIDISAVDNRRKEIVEPKTLPIAQAPSRAQQQVQAGDVLVSTTRPNLNAVAVVPTQLNGAIVSTGFAVLRPVLLEPRWLFSVVQSENFVNGMSNLVKGALYPAIRPSHVYDYEMPVPPLAEQKRITEKLAKLVKRIQNVSEALETLPKLIQQYRAAILEAACTGRLVPTEAELARKEHRDFEPASVLLKRIIVERRSKWEADQLAKIRAAGKRPENDKWRKKYPIPAEPTRRADAQLPQGWTWASLEQLTDPTRVICYGILMPKTHVESGVPYVKVRDMKEDTIDVLSLQRTSPKIAKQYERASLKAGDILLAIRGTYGKVAKVPKELEGGNITQDTARLAISHLTEAAFIMWQLRSPRMQGYFQEVARGVAVKGVNIGDIRPATIALPPVAEQKRIIAELERRLSVIDQTREAIQAALMECTNLRAALLNYAISGKLVGQHNGDQPAEELLTQIRIEREKRKHLPKQAKSHRKAKMKKLPLEAVKEAIKSLPQQRFTFKELSDSLQVDYDPLKDVVFELLGEAEPVLRQIFDSKAQTMQLERIKL
jgi:type I restriction enzyme, S subunit